MKQELPPQNDKEAKSNSNDFKINTPPKTKGEPFNFLIALLLVVIVWGGLSIFLLRRSENSALTPNYILSSPGQPNIPTTSPQNQLSSTTPQNDNSFDQEKISSIFPVLKNKKVYYLKEGNIWVVDLITPENKAKLFFDTDEEILSFDISNNQETLAYSVKRNSSPPDDFVERNGDTILIRNLKSSSEFELYSDKDATDIQIRSVLFSPNGKQLFFTNNSVWIADLDTKNTQKYLSKEKIGYCSVYFLEDISSDGRHILIQNGCFEGSSQIIFDVAAGKADSTFNNGYVMGGIQVFGFITNNLLLAVNNEGEGELEN
ncbi:MAG TPA: hypothetical protein P5267_03000, partial [Patescibacteria group bacterium]|nr:hypothetical protein [Patescibacteria group bacterium]